MGRNHIVVGDLEKERAYEIDKKATREFSEKKRTISWVHYDILEYFYGYDMVFKILFDMYSMKRSINANTIAITKPGQRINDEISAVCNYKFKISSRNDSVFIYGVKPKTMYYAFGIDPDRGFPNVKLTPLL